MMCPMFIIGLSLALLVLLGGLFLLAYTKKEGLGMLSKISAYIAILFGISVLVCGLICAVMCGSCKGNKDCKDGAGKCKMEMKGHCCRDAGMCEKSDMKCHKKMSMKHCASEGKMMCSKNDSGCCKDGVCKNADKDCCKEMEVVETTTDVKSN